ncbi:MAG TPA: SIS domain-containing protein [Nitrolancea sp.]|nr:SIS domain-containing protein [Nitrolancea sp.]
MALNRIDTLLQDEAQQETTERYQEWVTRSLAGRRSGYIRALRELAEQIADLSQIAGCLVEALASGHSVLIAGNGGSAAEAQHFAAELVGRFRRERAAYPVLALTADSAILTAVGNDYGFTEVFSRQVRGHGRAGDVLVVISTSGESPNLVEALRAAHERRMSVVALTGAPDCTLTRLADHRISVPHADTALAQEIHMLITHILCDIVEAELATLETRLA